MCPEPLTEDTLTSQSVFVFKTEAAIFPPSKAEITLLPADSIINPAGGVTTFGLAMPDELKDYGNPIQSYRDYYHLDKATFASWSYRDKPHWWNEDFADYEQRITAK